MPFRDTPIKRKLQALFLLTSGAVMAVTFASYSMYEYLTFRQTLRGHLSTLGDIIATNATAAVAFGDERDAGEILAALNAEPHVVAAALYDKDGRLFSTYPAGLPASAFPAAPEQDGYRFEQSRLVGFQPVAQKVSNQRLGTFYLASDLGAMYERIRLYGAIGAVIFVASLLVAFMASTTLQRQISEPVLALADTARAIANRRDYTVRAAKGNRDELGLLTAAFNQMLTRIEEQDQEQKRTERTIQDLNDTLESHVVERTAQLVEANKELESFSYSVSHDLRAPLRHVTGFATLLKNSPDASAISDDGRRYLNTILEASTRMGQLIDDLLAFSRVGRAPKSPSRVDLNQLVRDAQQELAAGINGHEVVWQAQELPVVEGDRAMLRLVFVNLLSNAVKYSSTRARSEIEVGTVPGEPGETVIFVRDNGVGFDMQYVGKLFGVFQRLHSDAAFEGTGIGLANVRRIVQRHGGRTWAEGALDRGATFYFTLPSEGVERSEGVV